MTDIYESHRETRDNLGSQDENKNIVLFGPYNLNLGVELGPTQLVVSNVGSSFVLGLATNAILGTTELGMASDYESNVPYRVVNPYNTFHEHFRYNNFNDSDNTTASFSTTYYNVNFDEDEIFQTLDIFHNLESIQYVTIYIDLTGVKETITIDDSGGQLVTLTEGT